VPDKPINLQNVPSITMDDRIGLLWEDGANNGGTTVLDYEIWYDQSTSNYVVLTTQLALQEFTATGLFSGSVYTFKVRARNSVGYSDFSNEFSQLTAQIPDVPAAPTTTISNLWDVVVDWTAPYNGGSSITSYTIEIRTTDITIFALDLQDCDGTDATIIAQTSCTVSILSTLRELPF